MPADRIIVLDFGSQYTHLLARRIRGLGVYSEIMLPDSASAELKGAKGIILSGGPASVYDANAPKFNRDIFTLGIPLLGLCYGQQLIGQEIGGEVEPGKVKEYGTAMIKNSGHGLFEGLPTKFTVWMSHGDKVAELPSGFSGAASTQDCEFAAISNEEKKIYGLQFHPEVTHTEHGSEILSNFVFKICGCKKSWGAENYIEQKIGEIQGEAKGKSVFMLLSGGVDSTVCLALLDRALGHDRIFGVHIDTGFMRKGESAGVKKELEKLGIKKVKVIDASKRFYRGLKGVSDPEEKRKMIGQLFIDVSMDEMEKNGIWGDNWLLGQGTIYPDTIETGGTRHANKIKTHHNRAPIVQKMIEEGKVIEPIKQLYKDEVRELGRLLGIPSDLVNRQPFPGPGLAIRVLCSSGSENAAPDSGLGIEENINKKIKNSGYKATLLPIKAVGVQGDNRTYKTVVMLEGQADYEKVEGVSTAITNAFNSVNRVALLLKRHDGNGKPKKQGNETGLRLHRAFLTKERVGMLQEADAIAMRIVQEKGLNEKIWQFPVVLLPIGFSEVKEFVVLRPVESTEAMTAKFFRLDKETLEGMVERILEVKGVGAVLLDVTHKPPATIEWE